MATYRCSSCGWTWRDQPPVSRSDVRGVFNEVNTRVCPTCNDYTMARVSERQVGSAGRSSVVHLVVALLVVGLAFGLVVAVFVWFFGAEDAIPAMVAFAFIATAVLAVINSK